MVCCVHKQDRFIWRNFNVYIKIFLGQSWSYKTIILSRVIAQPAWCLINPSFNTSVSILDHPVYLYSG